MTNIESNSNLNAENLHLVCRACLSPAGVLKNMTEWGLVQDFYKLTNIMITSSDAISLSLCLSCEDSLQKCVRFKRLCEESDLTLREALRKQLCSNKVCEENMVRENIVTFVMEENKLIITVIAPDTDSKIYFPCPHSCSETFLKKTDLLNHLIKNHNKGSGYAVDQRFYCSNNGCAYNIISDKNKYFTNRKLLNQHIVRVHADKNIKCDVCGMKFSTDTEYNRHLKTCNFIYLCQICDKRYNTNEKLLVHLMRKHPDLHQQYKNERRSEKRKSESALETKKLKADDRVMDYMCDSPKRSSATQTLENIRNDVTLSWQPETETKTDEISTQTVFEDLLSLKSQTSEDSIFCSEAVSLSDIQTQTFPLEFGLIRSNKETITSETQSPDLSMKETQTCLCLYDSRPAGRVSPNANGSHQINSISTETQTLVLDDLLRYSSAETQTSFDDLLSKQM